VTLKGQFAVPVGKSAITVKTTRPGSVPWIEAQFLTRGTPVSIKKKSN
jgi:hypothetical protein